MIPVSAAFAAALTQSHEARVRVEVIDATGAVIRDLTDAVVAGQVSADWSAATRRRASLTLAGKALESSGVTYGDLDASYGGRQATTYEALVKRGAVLSPVSAFELRIFRGVVVDDAVEWVPLGVFKVGSARLTDKGDVSVSAFDRSRVVALSGWPDVFVVSKDEPAEEVIVNTVCDRLGRDVPTVAAPSGVVTPLLVFGEQRGGNPWSDVTEIADTANLDVSFGPNGELRVLPFLDLLTAEPTWTFTAGVAGTVISRTTETSDAGVFNGVIVVSEHPDAGEVLRAQAWDTDPGSATFWKGPFGQRPTFITTAATTTAAAAQALADRKLNEALGMEEEVSIQTVPAPCVEAGDVVRITDADAGLDGLFVVTRVDVPLDVSKPMSVSARRLAGRTL